MAFAFNVSSVPAQADGNGIVRARLLTDERPAGSAVLLDHIVLSAGAKLRLNPPPHGLGWFQMLEGDATLKNAAVNAALSGARSALLPPGFDATLTAGKGATLLYAEIPGATKLDAAHPADELIYSSYDWNYLPVLQAKHDHRKRIPLVTPELCDTAAIKVEMVVYPSGSVAPDHYHEGAVNFVYVVCGHGTASTREQRFAMTPGELIYFPAREAHGLKAEEGGLRFIEFYAPGAYKTMWTDPGKASAWIDTDFDIHGRRIGTNVSEIF